ncbi:hypothetical protein EYF80_044657 [Liparis tanakae]|uniref:Uncharacterized protein n=1 Tax=Liparis tanakae TaxID=230148 RepID=A0A4Z2FV59_9TELE|nr:hypothetical protein EYF80_044657 [Liparis tanakae]
MTTEAFNRSFTVFIITGGDVFYADANAAAQTRGFMRSQRSGAAELGKTFRISDETLTRPDAPSLSAREPSGAYGADAQSLETQASIRKASLYCKHLANNSPVISAKLKVF